MTEFTQALSEFMSNLNQWHWFGLAVSLVILEVLLGASFFLLWLGLSAGVIALVLIIYPSLMWEYQLTLFSLLSFGSMIFWHIHLKHNPPETDKPRLNRRSEQYIGRIVTLKEPIENGRGKVNIDDSSWRVEGPDLPEGSQVRVVNVNGVVLQVEEINSD